MEIKIIDRENLVFEKKEGQKRRGWIRIQFKEGKQCEGCALYGSCHGKPGNSICSQLVTDALIHGNIIFTPKYYTLCQI